MRLFLSLGILALFAAPASAAVPSMRDLGISPATIAPLLGDSQLVLLHKERVHTWERDGEKQKKKASFITSMQVLNAPVEKVRAVVTDVQKYPEFIADIQEATEKAVDGKRVAEFEASMNLMVFTVDFDYTLAFTDEPNGDITWKLIDGDLGEYTGRWEFFELPGGKTLLAYTTWQDVESISFTVRTVLKAQPDMRVVTPAAAAAVIMNSLGRHVEGLPPEEVKPKVAQAAPIVPLLSKGGTSIPLPALRKLAETGTVMLIHPTQWFKDKKGKPVNLLFMSSAAVTSLPVEKLRSLTTNFENLPKYMPKQVDAVKRVDTTDGTMAYDYKLKVGISILTIAVRYRLIYEEATPEALVFKGYGDIEHSYGAWEFFDLGDGKSLVLYTAASNLGDDAPGILKMGNDMPNRDLIIGVSSTALTIQKLVPWLEKQ